MGHGDLEIPAKSPSDLVDDECDEWVSPIPPGSSGFIYYRHWSTSTSMSNTAHFSPGEVFGAGIRRLSVDLFISRPRESRLGPPKSWCIGRNLVHQSDGWQFFQKLNTWTTWNWLRLQQWNCLHC